MNSNQLADLHKHSIRNESEILKSSQCGCFYCNRLFNVKEIKDFIKEPSSKERTAICPYCGIDSVLGSECGVAITKDFLNEMSDYWFGKE